MNRAWIAVAAAAWFCAGACSESGAPEPGVVWPEPASDAVARTTESGPVKATVALWPAKPVLGDPIYLRLTVTAASAVTLDVPFERDALGRFRVTGYDARHEHDASGGAIEIRNYALEAPSSGRHRVPPLRFEFSDGRGAGANSTLELLTDELPLDVAPLPAAKVDAELKPARAALDPVVRRVVPWHWVAAAGSLCLLAVGGLLGLRHRRRRRHARAQLTAYEQAVAALAALDRKGAPAAADADGWFVELSAIVRRYLEERFQVRAPELTTEEFLQEAQRAPELDTAQRARLGVFLERCDRVKFAGWRPEAAESLATLAAAHAFIDETAAAPASEPR